MEIHKVRYVLTKGRREIEATVPAIRIARAYRKKYKVVKGEGGYHGSHDLVEISVKPSLDKAGPPERPSSVPEDVSVPPNVEKEGVVIPFNTGEAATRIIEQQREDLAAVIVEPVQGSCGMLPAEVGATLMSCLTGLKPYIEKAAPTRIL